MSGIHEVSSPEFYGDISGGPSGKSGLKSSPSSSSGGIKITVEFRKQKSPILLAHDWIKSILGYPVEIPKNTPFHKEQGPLGKIRMDSQIKYNPFGDEGPSGKSDRSKLQKAHDVIEDALYFWINVYDKNVITPLVDGYNDLEDIDLDSFGTDFVNFFFKLGGGIQFWADVVDKNMVDPSVSMFEEYKGFLPMSRSDIQDEFKAEVDATKLMYLGLENKGIPDWIESLSMSNRSQLGIEPEDSGEGYGSRVFDILSDVNSTATKLSDLIPSMDGLGENIKEFKQAVLQGLQGAEVEEHAIGGLLRGPSHANGGVNLGVIDGVVHEAEGGEYIIKKSSVDKIGVSNLNYMNKSRLPKKKYQEGGEILGMSTSEMDEFLESIGVFAPDERAPFLGLGAGFYMNDRVGGRGIDALIEGGGHLTPYFEWVKDRMVKEGFDTKDKVLRVIHAGEALRDNLTHEHIFGHETAHAMMEANTDWQAGFRSKANRNDDLKIELLKNYDRIRSGGLKRGDFIKAIGPANDLSIGLKGAGTYAHLQGMDVEDYFKQIKTYHPVNTHGNLYYTEIAEELFADGISAFLRRPDFVKGEYPEMYQYLAHNLGDLTDSEGKSIRERLQSFESIGGHILEKEGFSFKKFLVESLLGFGILQKKSKKVEPPPAPTPFATLGDVAKAPEVKLIGNFVTGLLKKASPKAFDSAMKAPEGVNITEGRDPRNLMGGMGVKIEDALDPSGVSAHYSLNREISGMPSYAIDFMAKDKKSEASFAKRSYIGVSPIQAGKELKRTANIVVHGINHLIKNKKAAAFTFDPVSEPNELYNMRGIYYNAALERMSELEEGKRMFRMGHREDRNFLYLTDNFFKENPEIDKNDLDLAIRVKQTEEMIDDPTEALDTILGGKYGLSSEDTTHVIADEALDNYKDFVKNNKQPKEVKPRIHF